MEDVQAAKAPVHLWVVGLLSLIWNGFGCTDYLMTRMHNMEWLAQSGGDPQAMLDWVEDFPIYAQFGWGLGVWMGVLGSLLLVFRSRWAVHAFALSLVGMVLSFGYQYLGAAPMPGGTEAGMMTYMPLVIFIIGLALFVYARAMARKGVLR